MPWKSHTKCITIKSNGIYIYVIFPINEHIQSKWNHVNCERLTIARISTVENEWICLCECVWERDRVEAHFHSFNRPLSIVFLNISLNLNQEILNWNFSILVLFQMPIRIDMCIGCFITHNVVFVRKMSNYQAKISFVKQKYCVDELIVVIVVVMVTIKCCV